jgi:FkbM family methyltransferase
MYLGGNLGFSIMTNYHSQYFQDRFCDKVIFNGKRNGYFIDIGAYDGVTISNSYFFEKHKEWSGICFEPNPTVFLSLVKNRKCECRNVGIGSKEQVLTYLKIIGPGEMLSGFKDFFDSRHIDRIKKETRNDSGSQQQIPIQVVKLDTFLDSPKIDFLSIDTEGNELEILKSIDFKKVICKVVAVENNYKTVEIEQYMYGFGYVKLIRLGCDEIFILKSDLGFSIKFKTLCWKFMRRLKLHKKGFKKRIRNFVVS